MKYYPLYPHLNLSSFRQLVDINAKEKPNHLAFQFQRKEKVISITYIQFKHDVDALASYFHLQGFHHSKISVLSGNSCYKDVAATTEALTDGWFHTGDLGYIDKDGFIYIKRKTGSLIILSNGKNASQRRWRKSF